MNAIRGRNNFTQAEDTVIDDWIRARLAELNSADQADMQKAGEAFRDAFRQQRADPDNSAQFSLRFAERVGSIFAAEYRQADAANPYVGLYMAWTIYDLPDSDIGVREALDAGLSDVREIVRYYSARTFEKFRTTISRNANLTQQTILRLKTAALTESRPLILIALYEAMSYDGSAQQVASAMAEILAARAKQRADGQQLTTDLADTRAWKFLSANADQLNQPEKIAVVKATAAHLALDVSRYAVATEDQRRIISERIEYSEPLLIQLTRAAGTDGGNIRAALTAPNAPPSDEAAAELAKWVGVEGQPGFLNAAPWNVPVGGV